MNRRCMGCMEEYDAKYEICPRCGYVEGTPAKEAYHIVPGFKLAGRYVVGRVLGFGGFGITYIGYDELLEHKVAIKEYMPSEFSTRVPSQMAVTVYSGERAEQFQEGLKKILEEARRLAQFESEPGIVHIYDCFEENNTAYIVMEYLEGECLKDRIAREGRMKAEEAMPIILAVLTALKKVHEVGIIHRDIAPDNIYLLKSGEVKLLDFGAARYATTKHSKSLSVIIKPGYAPEEQYRSRGDQGPWTDVYALAATFYKAITGVTPEDAMERSAKDELKRPSKLGVPIRKNVETAIMNALNIKIQDRTRSAAEFEAELLAAEVKDRPATRDKIDLGTLPLWVKIASGVTVLILASVFLLLVTGVIHFNITAPTMDRIAEGKALVPNIVNQKTDTAQGMIEEARLLMAIEGWDVSEEIEKGKILTQDLAAGTTVDEDSEIHVKVSAGGRMSRVPDVVGLSKEEAALVMEEASLLAEYQEKEYQAAPGTIAEQSLAANSMVKVGSAITLTVSLGMGGGDRETEVVLKNLTGMDYEAASDLLYKDYLYLLKTDSEYSDTVGEGKIISQEPAAGTKVNQQSNVKVVVSLGKEKVSVPNVTYIPLAEAEAALEAASLKAEVTNAYDEAVPKGNTVSQNIEENTLVEKGTVVKLVVSLGREPKQTEAPFRRRAETKPETRAPETKPETRAPETEPRTKAPSKETPALETPAPTSPPPTEPLTPTAIHVEDPTQASQDNGIDLNDAIDILNGL